MKNLKANINLKISKNIIYYFCLLIFGCKTDQNEYAEEENSNLFSESLVVAKTINENQSTYEDVLNTIRPFDAKLNKSKTINDFEFKANYTPHLFLAISNNDSIELNQTLNSRVLKSIENYKNLHYIKFSIENKHYKSELLRYDLHSQQEYSDRIMYYSFHSNKDVYIIENNKDTIRGSFVHFERTFDVSPKLNMTFVFERKETYPLDKLNFVFDDIIFNNGRLNFEFDYKTISVLNATEINKILL